jgi:salicylate hydroxylase
MKYNCDYSGAKDWVKRQREAEEMAYKGIAATA